MSSTTEKTRKLLEAATPGPWEVGTRPTLKVLHRESDGDWVPVAWLGNDEIEANAPERDAPLIAHARNVLLAYVQVAEALRALVTPGPPDARTKWRNANAALANLEALEDA